MIGRWIGTPVLTALLSQPAFIAQGRSMEPSILPAGSCLSRATSRGNIEHDKKQHQGFRPGDRVFDLGGGRRRARRTAFREVGGRPARGGSSGGDRQQRGDRDTVL